MKKQDLSYQDLLEKQNLHIAAASLFVHTALADKQFHRKEFNKIHLMIKDRFGYDDALIDHLIIHANRTNNEQLDVDAFIDVLNRNLNIKQKHDFLKMVWRIIIADGKIHPFEQQLADVVSSRLYIPRTEHEEIKMSVLVDKDPISGQHLRIDDDTF